MMPRISKDRHASRLKLFSVGEHLVETLVWQQEAWRVVVSMDFCSIPALNFPGVVLAATLSLLLLV